MNIQADDPTKPGTAQDAKAPQDETPPATPEKRKRLSAPGKSAKNEKPRAVERKRKNKLLSDDADITDETTI